MKDASIETGLIYHHSRNATENASAGTNQVEDTRTSSLDILSDIASSRGREQQPLE